MPDNTSKRILLLTGGHRYVPTNAVNIGDVAQLQNALDTLDELFPDSTVHVVAHSSSDDPALPDLVYRRELADYLFGKQEQPRRSALFAAFRGLAVIVAAQFQRWIRVDIGWVLGAAGRDALKLFSEAETLFVTGAGTLSDNYWRGPAFVWSVAMNCMQADGGSVILLGQQIGPLKRRSARFLIGRALRKAAFVGVRDSASVDEAIGLGADSSRVHLTGDEGGYLRHSHDDEIETFLAQNKVQRHFIAVQFRIDKNCPFADCAATTAEAIDAIAARLRAQVVLIPMSYADDADDCMANREVAERLNSRNRLLHIGANPRLTKGVISRAALAIGVANHFCVFAASTSVPTIGLYATPYMKQKLVGLQQQCDGMLAMPFESLHDFRGFAETADRHFRSTSSRAGAISIDRHPKDYFDWVSVLQDE